MSHFLLGNGVELVWFLFDHPPAGEFHQIGGGSERERVDRSGYRKSFVDVAAILASRSQGRRQSATDTAKVCHGVAVTVQPAEV